MAKIKRGKNVTKSWFTRDLNPFSLVQKSGALTTGLGATRASYNHSIIFRDRKLLKNPVNPKTTFILQNFYSKFQLWILKSKMEKLRFCSVLFNLFLRRKKTRGHFCLIIWSLFVVISLFFLKFFDHTINVVLAINVVLSINVVLTINVVAPIIDRDYWPIFLFAFSGSVQNY
jgi:hypothetical protein